MPHLGVESDCTLSLAYGILQFETDIGVAPGLVAQSSLKKQTQNFSRRKLHWAYHKELPQRENKAAKDKVTIF